MLPDEVSCRTAPKVGWKTLFRDLAGLSSCKLPAGDPGINNEGEFGDHILLQTHSLARSAYKVTWLYVGASRVGA